MNSRKTFIHIPKNGGHSIRKQFRERFLYADQFVNQEHLQKYKMQMEKHNEHASPNHTRWRDLNHTHLANWSNTCFAIVRNPWDRTVGRYTFMMKVIETGRKYSELYSPKTFEQFLEERHEWGDIPFFWYRVIHNWYPQKDHVTDEQENLRCDILRFEHYQHDATTYLNVGEIKYHNVSNGEILDGRSRIAWRKDYKEFYNDSTIQIVADWYKDDIDFFGFDFDTTATKNTWVCQH